MSALGQKQTFHDVPVMSALHPKADIGTQPCDVCFVPKADSCTATNYAQWQAEAAAGLLASTRTVPDDGRIVDRYRINTKQVFQEQRRLR